MALRLFLLALVGLMSFELPTGRDVTVWTERGSQWVSARVADLSHLKTEVENAFNSESRPEPTIDPPSQPDALALEIAEIRADVAFEGAMDRLVADFRTDLSGIAAARPLAVEGPIEVVVTDKPSVPIVEAGEPSCFDHEMETAEPLKLESNVETGPTAERLSSAVRLTKQALSAWASLIEGNPEDSR